MALDLAPSASVLILLHFLQVLYFILPVLFFKLKKWDVKEELIKRITPNPVNNKEKIMDIIQGILYGICFVIIGIAIWGLIRSTIILFLNEQIYKEASDSSINTQPPSISSMEIIILIILNYFLVGFCEEFFYRGVLFEQFKKRDPKIGAVISSILFAVYHVPPGLVPWITLFVFWPYYFIFGILLCKIVQSKNGNLLTAIIAHGTMNTILLIF